MSEADVQRLLANNTIRRVAPNPETAQTEIHVARRHIASAEKIMADDPTLAFTAPYGAMRKAIAAHMRSRGYRALVIDDRSREGTITLAHFGDLAGTGLEAAHLLECLDSDGVTRRVGHERVLRRMARG